MNRSFLMLLVFVVILGVALGGSFVGGVIYGQSRPADGNADLSPRLAAGGQFPGPGPAAAVSGQGQNQTPGQGRRGRQRESSGATDTMINRPANQVAESAATTLTAPPPAETSGEESAGPGNAAATGRAGLTGAAQSLEGNTLTIDTGQELRPVIVSETTEIQQLAPATIAEVTHGATVRILGRPDADGIFQARAVIILAEGATDLFEAGPGPRRGNRQRAAP